MAIDGTNIPAGTLHPYEMMTRRIRIIVAIARDITIDQRLLVLMNKSLLARSIPLNKGIQ